jgi:hypothetical protein
MNALEAVGTLVLVWAWTDGLTEDGIVPNATLEDVDTIAGRRGFGAAMQSVGWLAVGDKCLIHPKWERHNSQSAKRRALDAERKRLGRLPHACPQESGQASAPKADAERTREEEKRKDKEKEEEEGNSAPELGLQAETQTATPAWSKEQGWAGITETAKSRWRIAYPACDIDRHLAQMDAWLRANPTAAHKSAWERFITNWLKREQDSGGDQRGAANRGRRDYRAPFL